MLTKNAYLMKKAVKSEVGLEIISGEIRDENI